MRLSRIDEAIQQEVRPHVERNEKLSHEVLQLRDENDRLKLELSIRHTVAIGADYVEQSNADEGPAEGLGTRGKTAGRGPPQEPDASVNRLDDLDSVHVAQPSPRRLSVEDPRLRI